MFCNYCGKKNANNFIYCSYCGRKRTTGIASGKKTIKSKNSIKPKFSSEIEIGRLRLNDDFYIIIRLLTFFNEPGEYIDIRKTINGEVKLKGLSFNKQFLPLFCKILDTMEYNQKNDSLLLDEEIVDSMIYEDIELENGDSLSSSEIGKINIDEKYYILFNLLIFDNGNRYVDIRKIKKESDKRLQGLSIPINKINKFKEIMYSINK